MLEVSSCLLLLCALTAQSRFTLSSHLLSPCTSSMSRWVRFLLFVQYEGDIVYVMFTQSAEAVP
jgi:hypothetical protein